MEFEIEAWGWSDDQVLEPVEPPLFRKPDPPLRRDPAREDGCSQHALDIPEEAEEYA